MQTNSEMLNFLGSGGYVNELSASMSRQFELQLLTTSLVLQSSFLGLLAMAK